MIKYNIYIYNFYVNQEDEDFIVDNLSEGGTKDGVSAATVDTYQRVRRPECVQKNERDCGGRAIAVDGSGNGNGNGNAKKRQALGVLSDNTMYLRQQPLAATIDDVSSRRGGMAGSTSMENENTALLSAKALEAFRKPVYVFESFPHLSKHLYDTLADN